MSEKKEENIEEEKENDLEEKNVNTENQEENVEVEQLDDDEFEAEKAKAKAEKKAAKLARKQSKQVNNAEENPTKKKKNKKKMLIILSIILLIIIIVVGVIAYMVINPNNEKNFFTELSIESVIKDYAIYYNNENWEEFTSMVDMNGFLAYYAIETDEQVASEEGTSTTLSLANFDDIYANLDSYYEQLAETYPDYYVSETYEQLKEAVAYGQTYLDDTFALWVSLTGMGDLEIESVKSITKVENTESLYKVSVVYTYADTSTGSTTSDTDDIYVSRIDGKYKIVGGNLASIVLSAYYYEYYYAASGYSTN